VPHPGGGAGQRWILVDHREADRQCILQIEARPRRGV
jgi:hypothetical protein